MFREVAVREHISTDSCSVYLEKTMKARKVRLMLPRQICKRALVALRILQALWQNLAAIYIFLLLACYSISQACSRTILIEITLSTAALSTPRALKDLYCRYQLSLR